MKALKTNPGQILLEVLVAVSIAALILILGAQLIYVSLQGSKVSSEKNAAFGLLEETFETVRNSALENWTSFFGLSHGSTNYYPQKSSGKWVVATGTESIVINAINYSRSFIIKNVCRDNATREISGITDSDGSTVTCADISGSSFDASTQKITATVSWPGGETLSDSEFITRWRNKTCVQADWTSTGGGTNFCPATVYESQTNITPGTNLVICSGGC